MRFKKLFLMSLLLLAIIAIGSVSAQDNLTSDIDDSLNEINTMDDSIEADDTLEEASLNDDSEIDVLSSDDEGYQYKPVRLHSDNVSIGGDLRFCMDCGNYNPEVKIDGKTVNSILYGEDEIEVAYRVSTTGFDVGKHSLFVKSGDISETIPFWIKNIVVEIPDKIDLGKDYYEVMLEIDIGPKNQNPVAVTINGNSKTYTSSHISIELLKLTNLQRNNIIVIDYPKYNYHETFNVPTFYSIDFNRYNDIFTYKKSGKLEIKAPEDLSLDKFSATIDGQSYKIFRDYSTSYYINIPETLSIGSHVVNITYDGDNKFYKNNATKNIVVLPRIQVNTNRDWLFGEDNNITLLLPENATGSLNLTCFNKVYKNEVNYSAPIVDGIATINLKTLLPGNYNFTAKYTGTDYDVIPLSFEKEIDFYYWMLDCKIDENPTCYFRYIPTEMADKIIGSFNGKNYTGKYGNDVFEIKFDKATKIGNYIFTLFYVEDGKEMYKFDIYIRIYPTCSVPEKVTNGKGSVVVNAPGAEGTATVVAKSSKNQYSITVELVNGKATIPLDKLARGTYKVHVKYTLTNMHIESNVYTVYVYNTELTASSLTKYYGTSKAFKVKVANYKGKLVKSQYVKFYINGKYVKKVKTDKKGIVTLKINKAPGKYKITAKYGKVEITRNLNVKHIVTLKTAKVKRTAKKLVLSATLKQGKKPLKNKKVTFKFNGKTYKAKTNKKGVAKVTIKKSILKKLKVGKTVKYQAKYLKDTVKKSTKVI